MSYFILGEGGEEIRDRQMYIRCKDGSEFMSEVEYGTAEADLEGFIIMTQPVEILRDTYDGEMEWGMMDPLYACDSDQIVMPSSDIKFINKLSDNYCAMYHDFLHLLLYEQDEQKKQEAEEKRKEIAKSMSGVKIVDLNSLREE